MADRSAHAGGLPAAIARQFGWALITLLVLSLTVFLASSLKSGEEVARANLGPRAPQIQVDAFIADRGLDKPILVRYGDWLVDFTRGEWGDSLATGRSVRDDIQPRLERTGLLVALTIVVGFPISLLLGVAMANRWKSFTDSTLDGILIVLRSTPDFLIGVALLLLLVVYLGWLPASSAAGITFGTGVEKARAYILPVLTLSVSVLPYLARIARAAAHDALVAPSTQAARLRGLGSWRVTWGYGVREAAIPILTGIGLAFVHVTGAVIVVENIFGFPGVGQALISAVGAGDSPTVQAIVMALGAAVVVVFLLVDLVSKVLNPRLRAFEAA